MLDGLSAGIWSSLVHSDACNIEMHLHYRYKDALTKKDLLERVADLCAKHMFTMKMRSDKQDFVQVEVEVEVVHRQL